MRPFSGALLALAACAPPRPAEDPSDWFDTGVAAGVGEEIIYTDENYNFDGGIADLNTKVFPVAEFSTAFAPGDGFENDAACDAVSDSDLPMEVEGIVTILPRLYIKSDGCGGDGDEKFYGSFFLQDESGGTFVLGDTKTAHFEAGNKVKIKVRSARTPFEVNQVYTWDLLDVDRTVYPIYYEPKFGPLGGADLYRVIRVTGKVVSEKDTFGAFDIEADDGSVYSIALDTDLNRRGYEFPVGAMIQATGPVLLSYSVYSIVIMSVGQITEL